MIGRFPLFVLLLSQLKIINGYNTVRITWTINKSIQSSPFSSNSPASYGINAGHKCPQDRSWIAFMKRLGVKKVRLFGVGKIAGSSSIARFIFILLLS